MSLTSSYVYLSSYAPYDFTSHPSPPSLPTATHPEDAADGAPPPPPVRSLPCTSNYIVASGGADGSISTWGAKW